MFLCELKCFTLRPMKLSSCLFPEAQACQFHTDCLSWLMNMWHFWRKDCVLQQHSFQSVITLVQITRLAHSKHWWLWVSCWLRLINGENRRYSEYMFLLISSLDQCWDCLYLESHLSALSVGSTESMCLLMKQCVFDSEQNCGPLDGPQPICTTSKSEQIRLDTF